MVTSMEVMAVRLYWKNPGSHQLRKSSAAELATLEAAGWQEKNRTSGADHVVVRMERPRRNQPALHTGGAGNGSGRPRR